MCLSDASGRVDCEKVTALWRRHAARKSVELLAVFLLLAMEKNVIRHLNSPKSTQHPAGIRSGHYPSSLTFHRSERGSYLWEINLRIVEKRQARLIGLHHGSKVVGQTRLMVRFVLNRTTVFVASVESLAG